MLITRAEANRVFTDYSECYVGQFNHCAIRLLSVLITVNVAQRTAGNCHYHYLTAITLLITVNIDERGYVVY